MGNGRAESIRQGLIFTLKSGHAFKQPVHEIRTAREREQPVASIAYGGRNRATSGGVPEASTPKCEVCADDRNEAPGDPHAHLGADQEWLRPPMEDQALRTPGNSYQRQLQEDVRFHPEGE